MGCASCSRPRHDIVVGESGLAHEATRRIPAVRPDVAIFDARLPDGSGIAACREVRAVDPSIKGIVLTSYDDEEAMARAVARRRICVPAQRHPGQRHRRRDPPGGRGQNLLDTAPARLLADQWSAGAETDPRLRLLTPQERLILDHVARGLTNRQIAEAMHLAEKTVKNYITSVLAKLGMERRTQAAVYAVQHPRAGQRSTGG